MAGGKLSPRQKMINLMYLVFIAMLAMNMSKQVLSAFGIMNEKLTEANVSADNKNGATYASLATKASDQPDKFSDLNKEANNIKVLSQDFNAFVETMRGELTAEVEDVKNYESMDGTDAGDSYFFKGEEYTEKGKAFLDKINNYRTKVADILKKAQKKKEFSGIISSLKTRFDTSDQEVEDVKNYESMDGTDAGDSYFFKGEEFTEKGKAFLDKINNYRTKVAGILKKAQKKKEFNGIISSLNTRFDTSDQKLEEGTQPWLKNRYEGFPLITTVTNLSQIQADIKATESEMLTAMVQGQLESDVSMSNYTTILIPESPATLQGANFRGKIVLGRYDASLKPTKVIVNGKEITNIKDGGAVLEFPAGNVGENEIKGEFIFKEGDSLIRLPIQSKYAVVAKPNSAVISADKMNIVYRGVQNPMTISMPGVPDNSITVGSTPGLRKVKGLGKYVMSPGKGKTVKINVTGKMPDGTSVTSGQIFRIKSIPAPMAAVRGNQWSTVKMPKSSLQKMTISALIPDFEFDLKINVSGFSVRVPGSATVIVRGRKFNAAAIRALGKARKGDMVTIFDVKASLAGNSGYYLKKVGNLTVQITN